MDPSSDITIDYILTVNGSVQTESEYLTNQDTISIDSRNGTVTTSPHTLSVPTGDIGVTIKLSHPSVGSSETITETNNTTIVTSGIETSGEFLYVTETENNTINQYTVSTPFDITTASHSTSINAQEFPEDIAWNTDGTKLYELSDKVYEYNVSTPFDISTATLSQSLNKDMSSITWNPVGTKLHLYDGGENKIYEYDVSTPFDISIATVGTSINAKESNTVGIAWNETGTKLYEVNFGEDTISEHPVSNPFDISTAASSVSTMTTTELPMGATWKPDGTKIYYSDYLEEKIYEYTVSTPYDISTSSLNNSLPTSIIPEGIVWGGSTS